MISLHTSPLDQPGTGDAGGMNVYVLELSRRLAERNLEVEIYTRATSSALEPVVDAAPGVRVHHVAAGPYEGLGKEELPAQLCIFARHLLRAEAGHEHGWFDLIHSHYWLSGQVGALVRDRWSVPLVHTMHTMAKVKNASLAEGDTPEPAARLLGEDQVVEAADMLIANTDLEARQLIDLYDADPARVEVVHPGVDLGVFVPASAARGPRPARPARPTRSSRSSSAGSSPSRRPTSCSRAVALLVARGARAAPAPRSCRSSAARPAPASSTRRRWPTSPPSSASATSSASCRRSTGPRSSTGTPPRRWSACRPTTSPSGWSPSRPSAVGTPVVAASVGGLTTVVRDGVTGLLVDGHDPADYAAALRRLATDTAYRERLASAAALHARDFAWERTADRTLEVYRKAARAMRQDLQEALRG